LKEETKANTFPLRKPAGLPNPLHAISNTTVRGMQTQAVFCAQFWRIFPTWDVLWSCQCPVLLNTTFCCWLYSWWGESKLSVVPDHPWHVPAVLSLTPNTFITMVTVQLLQDWDNNILLNFLKSKQAFAYTAISMYVLGSVDIH